MTKFLTLGLPYFPLSPIIRSIMAYTSEPIVYFPRQNSPVACSKKSEKKIKFDRVIRIQHFVHGGVT